MTPIKLLTKSNSIRGMTDRAPGYKMTKLALPRFTPKAGPLRVEMEPAQQPWAPPMKIVEAEIVEPRRITTAEPAPELHPVLEIPVILERPTLPEPLPSPGPMVKFVKPSKPKPRVLPAIRAVFSRIWKKFTTPAPATSPKPKSAPFAEPVQAPPPPSPLPAQPRITKARAGIWELLLRRLTFRRRPVRVNGVQTELALEKVSVIRNDLSDADLEVVPRMDAQKRAANPFRGAAKGRRAKKAEEEKSMEPALVPTFGDKERGKPTD